MKRFFAWITALLMLLSLAACSSTQTSTAASSQQASTSETGKSENELIAEENDILAANNALWEKVFASMDKNVTDTTLSSNYGDILMNALDHAKDQFTDEEYAALKADADKIREIEAQIAALPPFCCMYETISFESVRSRSLYRFVISINLRIYLSNSPCAASTTA